jgi:hypothetical protein
LKTITACRLPACVPAAWHCLHSTWHAECCSFCFGEFCFDVNWIKRMRF